MSESDLPHLLKHEDLSGFNKSDTRSEIAADHVVSEHILSLAKQYEPPSQLQAFLWNWLASVPQGRADLLPLFQNGILVSSLGTAYFKGLQHEESYIRLIASLPGEDNPARADFWRAVAFRLGDLFRALAADQHLRDSLSGNQWIALVDFSHRVCMNEGIAQGVVELQECFDAIGQLPFHYNPSLTFEFSRLLGRVQPDNRFKDRWIKLISESVGWDSIPDQTLRATYIQAWQSYCLMPDPVTLDEFEDVAKLICVRLCSDFTSIEILRKRGVELLNTPTFWMEDWKKLAFARLWDEYSWLPDPHPQLHLIACIDEIAHLGQLIESLRRRWAPGYERIAELKYASISEALLLPKRIKSMVEPPVSSRWRSQRSDENKLRSDFDTTDELITRINKSVLSCKYDGNFDQVKPQ
jgi:hypothetical protein